MQGLLSRPSTDTDAPMYSDLHPHRPLPMKAGDEHAPEVVLTAGRLRGRGLGIWRDMVQGVLARRELLALLIRRDIAVRYRQSFLGYVWALVPPVALAFVFSMLAAERVIPIGQLPGPYVPFALLNLAVWHLFAGCVGAGTDSLLRAGSLVTKVSFPKELLVLATAGPALFDLLIRLIPVAIAFAWYGVMPQWSWLAFPLLLLPIVALALGLAFVLAVGNLVIRDVGHLVGMTMTFGLFVTPVLYPPPVREPFLLVNLLNPVSPLLAAIQDAIFEGRLTAPALWGAYALLGLLTFLVGWRVFYLILPRITERA